MSIKILAKSIIPPLIWGGFSKLAHRHENHPDYIFDNQANTYKSLIRSANGYLEYGIGKSTIWALNNSRARIYGVDSSSVWVSKVRSNCVAANRIDLLHVDLGPIGDWGRPTTLQKIDNICKYTNSHWLNGVSNNIDIVLIDGRFRISCFYATIAYAKPGCVICFDDYVMRPIYSVVEGDLQPVRLDGRQAVFEVPKFSDSQRSLFADKSKFFELVFD